MPTRQYLNNTRHKNLILGAGAILRRRISASAVSICSVFVTWSELVNAHTL